MKTSVVEDVSAVIEARKNREEEPKLAGHHDANTNDCVWPILDDRCLTELLGFDAARAVTNVLAHV